MLGKLTWVVYGLMLLAGMAACSQESREPVEVGVAQVELRSDLALPETPGTSTALLGEEHPDHPGPSTNPVPTSQRNALSELEAYSRDRAYRDIQRYELLPDSLKDSKARKHFDQGDNGHANSWTLADKYWVRAGKGFGVATEGMTSVRTVRPDDASYYLPAVVSKPYSKPPEHLVPIAQPFKNRKPLVFHSGATGFAHEPSVEAVPSGHSPVSEARLDLSPIPETQVYLSAKPNTQVTLAPAKNRLDLMNGNENLNRDRFNKLP